LNLNELFELQAKLDERIYKEHPPKEGEDRLAKKILALQVELGELANELPEVFKFWSNKKNNYEKALEELVDCLHFILSIGLDLNFETEAFFGKYTSPNLTRQFNFVFQDVSELSESILEDFPEEDIAEDFYELVCEFIGLADMLGFTWDQVEQAYLAKNKINHERQESGY
jgi:dimeric dUTPase (all-alpha-NTP-PPase superfamily)